MSFEGHPLAAQRIADIVRLDLATAQTLADLGIGPRYLYWTLRDAAHERGADLEEVIRAIHEGFGRRRAPETAIPVSG